MALYPNGHINAAGYLLNIGSYLPLTQFNAQSRQRINNFSRLSPTSSHPEGAAPRAAAWLPIKAGGMSGVARIEAQSAGELLQGGPMEGSGSMSFTSDAAGLSLTVSMSGNGLLTWTTPQGVLRLTVGLDGAGSFTLTGTSGLSMVVPFEGSGSFAMGGTSDLRGRLSMQGQWTPFTELSPQNLAAAVWDAVASQYNDPGTMGARVNSAATGGVDLNALAQAVWEYATRTLTSAASGGMTTEQAEQLAEIWRIHGLDPAAPLNVTPTSRSAGDVAQTISGDGATSTTVSRLP